MPDGDTPPASGEAPSTANTPAATEPAAPGAAAESVAIDSTKASVPGFNNGLSAPLPFDFRQPRYLAPIELKKLRPRHDEFAHSLAARLSLYLRMEVTASLVELITLPYADFTKTLASPTHLSLFKVEPLPGIGLLEIPVKLGLTMVDRLLGGPAQGISADHGLSEIELALLAQVVHVVIAEWALLWSINEALKPKVLGYEPSGQFVQSSPRDTLMLVLVLQVKLGEAEEKLQLAIPCQSLEHPILQMSKRAAASHADSNTGIPASLRWNRGFDDIRVPVVAFWDHLELKARELANLKPGDVLHLEQHSLERVRLRLGNLPKFEGRLGTANGKWAVALTGLVKLEP